MIFNIMCAAHRFKVIIAHYETTLLQNGGFLRVLNVKGTSYLERREIRY
jgi:hypothetical protein